MKETINVSRKVLQAQYNAMKVDDICEYYGICLARLYKLLDLAKIERKHAKHRSIKIFEITE